MTPTHLNVVIIIFASIDVVLEPYFLFLIIRKSSPGMRIYRVFLILISLSNFIFSISFFVDSPTMFLTQSYLFIVSSTLSPIYAWFLWQFEMSFLAIQLQFSLLMVMYASYEITHPIKGLNLKSKWLWLFSLVFILGPAFGYVACNYKARVTYEYYNFSPSGSGLPLTIFLFLYSASYSVLAAYSVFRIRKIVSKPSEQVSQATIKLVNTVVKNFLITVGNVFFFVSGPVFVAVVAEILHFPGLSSLVFSITVRTVAVYVTVSTIASIFIFAPYRKYTLRIAKRMCSCRKNVASVVSVDSKTNSVLSWSKKTRHK